MRRLPGVGLRPEVLWFATEMEQVLQFNDHKTGWKQMSEYRLLNRLKQEIIELEKALAVRMSPDRIVSEACDIANFAMMIADNYSNREV